MLNVEALILDEKAKNIIIDKNINLLFFFILPPIVL